MKMNDIDRIEKRNESEYKRLIYTSRLFQDRYSTAMKMRKSALERINKRVNKNEPK